MEKNCDLYKISEVNNCDDDDNFCNTNKSNKLKWWSVPEPILFRIYWMLPIKDLLNAGATCKRWFTLSNDELMWKQKFLLHYKVDATVGLKPGIQTAKCKKTVGIHKNPNF